MNRRQVLRLAGGGFIAAATLPSISGCSSALPPEALVAWQPPPESVDLRRWVLSHALLAPNAHNLQSWLADLSTPESIVLRMDLDRLLPQTDPFSRQLVISQGTFIELLDLAARQRGYRADIRPFPEGAYSPEKPDARPVAHIRLLRDAAVRPDPLFAQVFRRHTHRGAYQPRVPEAAALKAMQDSTAGLAAHMGWVSRDEEAAITRHRQIASDAWRAELITPRTLLESYKLLRIGPQEIAQHRDGIAINSPVVRLITALGLFDRSQASAADSSEIKDQIKQFNEKIATTPAFCWISTAGNDRLSQLNAGRAYVRLQLAAASQGLSLHPLSQALQEYPEQAPYHRAIHHLLGADRAGHTVQMWTRLGYSVEASSPSPRRGLQSLVQTA